MCARRIASASFTRREIDDERPPTGETTSRAGSSAPSRCTTLGVFAALDMRTNKIVWQQHWPDTCYSGSTTTAGGLVFVGRNDGRLTALELGRRHEALGVPNRRRHERARQRVRARGQAVRRRVLGRQPVRGLAEGRQRLAVRPRRHARARAAGGRRDDVHARSRRHGRSRRGQDGVRQRVHVLPRRARRRRPRRRRSRSSTRAARTSWYSLVSEGRNEMPPFGASLTPEQIRDVAAYVATKLPH